MKDVYYNDTPFKDEIGKPLAAEAFAGQMETASAGGRAAAGPGQGHGDRVSDLAGPGGKVPARAVDVGFVSYRLSRVTAEGSVYTIAPRFIMPQNSVDMPKDVTRRFWLAVKTPADAKPGLYKGTVTVKAEKGGAAEVPLELTVRTGTLDPLDIPAGPWGYTLNIPWFDDDPACKAFNQAMAEKSLRKMREYGFTIFSGAPHIRYQGFKDGKPVLDFSAADPIMKLAKDLGFLAVSGYGGGVSGFDAYFQDTNAMNAAGFKDYSEFIKAVYTEVQKHADAAGWLPVHYNLGDEPLEEAAVRAAENAAAYSKAFPKGPPFFSAATSFEGKDTKKPHYLFAKALQISNLNGHDEDSVKLIHDAGRDWAFYNGGNRWTFGYYMYKAVKQFDMKFRITWHWSCAAGDPFYALDAREDDYAFASATPDGGLMMWLECERIREGVDDYRLMLTLAHLAKEKAGTPAAKAAEDLIAQRMAAFKLGQREHDPLFPIDDWQTFRHKMADAIEALRK